MLGYDADPSTPTPTTTYWNTLQSYTAYCPVGSTGDPVTRSIEANTYSSTESQAAADALALAAAQAAAEAARVCTGVWWNTEQSFTAACDIGYSGGPLTVTIPAGTYTSLVSQDDADNTAYLAAKSQAEAALVCVPEGSCTNVLPTMTGYNTPSGLVFVPTDRTGVEQVGYEAWRCMGGGTFWPNLSQVVTSTGGPACAYQFTGSTTFDRITVTLTRVDGSAFDAGWKAEIYAAGNTNAGVPWLYLGDEYNHAGNLYVGAVWGDVTEGANSITFTLTTIGSKTVRALYLYFVFRNIGLGIYESAKVSGLEVCSA